MRRVQAVRHDWVSQQEAARDVGRGSEQYKVPIGELLASGFVSRHSRFKSLSAMLSASSLEPRKLIDMDAATRERWDAFTRLTTAFPDWDSMLREAGAEWLIRRLGIIVDA
jgi:hypothetical protein